MINPADPMQIAAISAAIVWPLAAGATLVLWTKARAAERRRRLALIEGGLQGMFRAVARQPLPDHLELVVDALEEHVEMSSKFVEPTAAGRKTAPAG
ncbi:MAG TPA: hypothetical protein VHV27_10640 [Phenylobacterium sp.]|jgi:hypothetical protein|nr:hypothetical protein [Phenylobacterium sp.]